MQTFKIIALASSLVMGVASAAFALPACPISTSEVWTNCYGTRTLPDGGEYVGEWKDDKKNGYGTFSWPDGRKYVGEWKDDEKNGYGTFTAPTGAKLVGELKDGVVQGYGVVTLPTGPNYVGELKGRLPHGQGFAVLTDGTASFCSFIDGKDCVNGGAKTGHVAEQK